MEDGALHISKKDQMYNILQVLGKPNSEDMSFVTDGIAFNYVK